MAWIETFAADGITFAFGTCPVDDRARRAVAVNVADSFDVEPEDLLAAAADPDGVEDTTVEDAVEVYRALLDEFDEPGWWRAGLDGEPEPVTLPEVLAALDPASHGLVVRVHVDALGRELTHERAAVQAAGWTEGVGGDVDFADYDRSVDDHDSELRAMLDGPLCSDCALDADIHAAGLSATIDALSRELAQALVEHPELLATVPLPR